MRRPGPLLRRLFVALVVAATLTACGGGGGGAPSRPDPAPTAPTTPPSASDTRSARDVVAELQARLDLWRQLPPADRAAQAAPFGPDLERALAKVAGTRFENQVAYWLATWRFEYAGGKDVEPCLARIAASQWPAFKHFAKVLAVQLELRHGDLDAAEGDAEKLFAEMPEYQSLLNQVALHRKVGSAPPMTSGRNISGGPADPSTRPEDWLLFVVLDPLDDEHLYLLQCALDEAARPELGRRMRVVCVTGGSNVLGEAAQCRALRNSRLLDLLWEPANAAGQNPWRVAWGMAEKENALILLGPGPQRLVLAVLDGHPEDLRGLLVPEK
jgi:hypothetical protein